MRWWQWAAAVAAVVAAAAWTQLRSQTPELSSHRMLETHNEGLVRTKNRAQMSDEKPSAQHAPFKSAYSDPGQGEHPPSWGWHGMEQKIRSRKEESIPELGCGPSDVGCVAIHAALDWSRVEFGAHSIFEKAVHALRAPKSPTVSAQKWIRVRMSRFAHARSSLL